jgi:NTE family protein
MNSTASVSSTPSTLIFVMSSKPVEADSPRRPKIGVVLGSGGIKPLAAVAVFDFLEESRIDCDLLVGCSGGSLIAGGKALGYSTERILELYRSYFRRKPFSTLDYRTLLGIANFPLGRFNLEAGIVKPMRLLRFFRDVYGDSRLGELHIPTVLQATDIQTGRGVVLNSGSLAEAIYASTAMYPIVPPIQFQGKWLVDGAFTSPLPLLEAVKRKMDIVIAVIFNEKNNPEPKQFFEGFYNIISSFTRSLTQSQVSMAVEFHHYEIIFLNVTFDKRIAVTDSKSMADIVDAGRRAVDAKKDEILKTIQHFNQNTID